MSTNEHVPPETLRDTAAASFSVAGYESLAKVLADAYRQAAVGKGEVRHGNGTPFDQQPMQKIMDRFGRGFGLGQAAKKMEESLGMHHDAARAELLGAIVYLSGVVIHMDNEQP